MKYKSLFAVAFAALCCINASAGVSGQFDMSGIVTATTTTITWKSDASGNTADFFTLTLPSGSFLALPSGSQEVIHNLNTSFEPVGVTFSGQPFIEFPNPAGNGLPALLINFIYPGLFSQAGCLASPPAVGQSCTPTGSPFSFINNPGLSAPQATVFWVLSGETSDRQSTWSGVFTAQFNVPFQTVLAELATAGQVTNSYSAVISVTPVALGTQGCTPGYWKNHLTGTLANTAVGTLFSGLPASFANETLIQALQGGGGSGISGALTILLRAAVAGLLNATNPNVQYSLTAAQVVSMVNAAIASGDRDTILSVATTLDNANNGSGGCPLS